MFIVVYKEKKKSVYGMLFNINSYIDNFNWGCIFCCVGHVGMFTWETNEKDCKLEML